MIGRRAARGAGSYLVIAVLSILMVSACSAPGAESCGLGGEPSHPDVGGEILYTCYAPGLRGSLFLLDVGSGRARRLTPDQAWNIDAAWSPDGGRIAYQSTREGRSDIFIMDVASGEVRRLTDGRGFNGYPTWSPDSRYIAFESSRDGVAAPPDPPGYYRTIYVIGVDGTGAHPLLTVTAVDSGPDWSPAGDRIVFASDRHGPYDVYTVGVDGSDLRQLTHHDRAGGSADYPRWSPDGRRIVFNAFAPDAGHGEVYWMEPGVAPQRVTSDPGAQFDGWPDWSPDGRWIVFTRAADAHQLFAVHPDGTGLVQLTNDEGDKDLGRWRP